MAQSDGPSTESGILFQNSIASLYLGDLIELGDRSKSECVVAVRVEAPTHVDDIVVTCGDSHCIYIPFKPRSAWTFGCQKSRRRRRMRRSDNSPIK